MLIAIFPIPNVNQPSTRLTLYSGKQFFFNEDSIKSINEGISITYIEELIMSKLSHSMTEKTMTIIDDNEHIVAKFTIENEKVYAEFLDRYQ